MKWLRIPLIHYALTLSLLALLLVLSDRLCYSVTLPVELDMQHDFGVLHVGSTSLTLGMMSTPTTLQIPSHDPVVHEYQIDGTDSTNNFTLDTNYLTAISSTPYYRFQAWIRDLDGTSHWRDIQIYASSTLRTHVDWPDEVNGTSITLPASSSLHIKVQLQRPETPVMLNLLTSDGSTYHISLDRNDRYIKVTRDNAKQGNDIAVAQAFFPTDIAPFAAMVLDTIIRSTLWGIVVLFFVMLSEGATTTLLSVNRYTSISSTIHTSLTPRTAGMTHAYHSIARVWQRLAHAIHPIGLLTLAVSLCFVSWISLVQYHAEPHIFDASAYFFAAKMYATGHLWVPVPAAIDRFPGAFMVTYRGRWFGQYAPGTALALVPGIWLGVPWLVEPVLGTFALLGIGLLVARLYDRRVATLAVVLGVLSPFYSYLSASYLSHTVALFFFVWGLFLLVRFAQGERLWNVLLSATLFGMAGLTRDLVTVLLVAVVVVGVVLLMWRQMRQEWRRWLEGGLFFLAIALLFVGISLAFNALITGNPWITPRSLFFAGDRWGFGQGIGFYGQHTLAAGFVNMDELLTILAIDLYGWPFYLTFAFLLLPFLALRAKATDWFALLSAVVIGGAYIGYFYHGIYLGPRYLFETLPFLLILTARGIFTLSEVGVTMSTAVRKVWTNRGTRKDAESLTSTHTKISFFTALLVIFLIGCNLFYFLPRQVILHQDFNGYPSGYQLDLNTIYHPPLHNAIIVTGDAYMYEMVLFPLNDPYLHGNVIYALANSELDYQELRTDFPGRTLYQLKVAPDGSVQYAPI